MLNVKEQYEKLVDAILCAEGFGACQYADGDGNPVCVIAQLESSCGVPASFLKSQSNTTINDYFGLAHDPFSTMTFGLVHDPFSTVTESQRLFVQESLSDFDPDLLLALQSVWDCRSILKLTPEDEARMYMLFLVEAEYADALEQAITDEQFDVLVTAISHAEEPGYCRTSKVGPNHLPIGEPSCVIGQLLFDLGASKSILKSAEGIVEVLMTTVPANDKEALLERRNARAFTSAVLGQFPKRLLSSLQQEWDSGHQNRSPFDNGEHTEDERKLHMLFLAEAARIGTIFA